MKRKSKGRGLTQKILKGTRVISRIAKFVGKEGSPIHNFGKYMHQHGYGGYHLAGRLRLN